MKHLLVSVVAVVLAFATVSAYAQRKEGGRGKRAAGATETVSAPLQEMTLTGKIAQTETTKTNKAGVDVKIVKSTLTETDGTVINLSGLKKTGAPTVDLAKYVGKDVTIVGQGRTETAKNGNTLKRLVSITTIAEVLPPPPVAAPATEPAAVK